MPEYIFEPTNSTGPSPEASSKAHTEGPVRRVLCDPPAIRRLRFFALRPQISLKEESRSPQELRDAENFDQYGIASSSRPRAGQVELDSVIRSLNGEHDKKEDVAAKIVTPRSSEPTECKSQGGDASAGAQQVARAESSRALIGVLRQSAIFRQLELRASVILMTFHTFHLTLPSGIPGVQERSRVYMRFWNAVWLILNDLILGYCARAMLKRGADHVMVALLKLFEVALVEAPISCLDFLNDWPVGLKLNTPLSQFFCSSATLLIQHWNELVTPLLQTHGPLLLTVIANSALLGLTLLLSIVSDALSVLALHIRLSHAAASFVFSLQRDSLSGLFNLFRGKRWNVLRQRTDSYQYDIDQLFLGTVLFTVSIFLMPTTTSYAGFFAAIHLALWAIQKTIERAVQALNAFPLFEVMLRIKEPSRLPSGVYFEVVNSPSSGGERAAGKATTSVHVLRLHNSPKSFADIIRNTDAMAPT